MKGAQALEKQGMLLKCPDNMDDRMLRRVRARDECGGGCCAVPSAAAQTQAAVDAAAERHGIDRRELLASDAQTTLAARAAIAEADVLAETRAYLEQEGVAFADTGASTDRSARSETALLVKNLSRDADARELECLFAAHGEISRVCFRALMGVPG